ncbi:hypothetical protein C0993_001539 [Termitomyces sp. T159_Od127]|nr:hypothetical protein C0993_001539 [Termitomyces sp. T159_Od127]
MTYKDGDEAAARLAERLTVRAASEVEWSSPALVFLPQNRSKPASGQVFISQPTFSFYPFQPSQLRSQAAKQMSLFRVRRMEDCFRSDLSDKVQDADGPSEIAHVMDFSGNSMDLRHALLAQDSSSGVNHRVTASFGHLLVSTTSSKSSITPPLSGSQELLKLSEWFRTEEPKRVFISSLPHALINCAPAQQHMIHRIIYRSPSTSHECEESLKFELVLDSMDSTSSKKSTVNGDNTSLNRKDPLPKGIDSREDVVLAATCWAESSRHLDLMLPDRCIFLIFGCYSNIEPVLQAYGYPILGVNRSYHCEATLAN